MNTRAESSERSRKRARPMGIGEIVAVDGGHIVKSTGRKDRHSKVCTARGLRDRRVRLSAHTAIQFYDVQDRLGYDRPSKAVDWLMKNAKASIDELSKSSSTSNPNTNPKRSAETAPSNKLSKGKAKEKCRPKESARKPNDPQAYLNTQHLPSCDSQQSSQNPFLQSFGAAFSNDNNQTQSQADSLYQTFFLQNLGSCSNSVIQEQPLGTTTALQNASAGNLVLLQQNNNSTSQILNQYQNVLSHSVLQNVQRLERAENVAAIPCNQEYPTTSVLRGGGGHGCSSPFPATRKETLQSSSVPAILVRPISDQFASPSFIVRQHADMDGGFSGYRIPARIQGIEEEVEDSKPSSAASSNSLF
eukprot:TRINITY_DN35391_c0_g1_i1.p1 TRINITY_DN35391_c0_g1~~TRINITY_DN35391_c0_g1_i1.p1  ORF type:complete len:360 (+),score=30.77 TRINITY_DN35391_c0_g1_i1:970-2049(+)